MRTKQLPLKFDTLDAYHRFCVSNLAFNPTTSELFFVVSRLCIHNAVNSYINILTTKFPSLLLNYK